MAYKYLKPKTRTELKKLNEVERARFVIMDAAHEIYPEFCYKLITYEFIKLLKNALEATLNNHKYHWLLNNRGGNFRVKCDEENNPLPCIMQGDVNAIVTCNNKVTVSVTF